MACLANLTLIFSLALLLSLSSLPLSTSNDVALPTTTSDNDKCSKSNPENKHKVACQVQQMRLHASQLEFLLEVASLEDHTKTVYIETGEKKIEDMNQRIHELQSLVDTFKLSSEVEELMTELEEEVRELEAIVRNNDWLLFLAKQKAIEREYEMKLMTSKIQTLSAVVPELWLQLQRLEQAVLVIQRRTAELRIHIRNNRCPIFKFVNNYSGGRRQKAMFALLSEAMNQLRWSFSALKKYHHQLQGIIKHEMEKSDFVLDEELIFLLASVMIVFPLMLALKWLKSHWGIVFLVVLASICLRQ